MSKVLWKVNPDSIPDKKKVIGFITDTHIPAEVPGYLKWVQKVFADKGVNCVYHGGDIFDYHAASFHEAEDEALSGVEEVQVISERLVHWVKAFPYMTLMEGNHDAIPTRKAKKAGLAAVHIRTPHELYPCLTKKWKWKADYHLVMNGKNGTEFTHGLGSGGMYGCINTAQKRGGSLCQGHTHAYAAVIVRANQRRVQFGLNGGCGFDSDHYAANYGKHFPLKGVVGVSIVYSDTHAEFIPMPMGTKTRV